jgi:hypothetical protein
MYDMHWKVVDGEICKRVDDDLTCTYPTGTTTSPSFFSRIAYHQFATISATKPRKLLSAEEILCGDYAQSILHRQALGLDKTNCSTDLAIPSGDTASRLPRTDVSQYLRPEQNEHAAALAEPAPWHLETLQACVEDYSKAKGTTLDRSDQWQCPIGNVSFVHIPKTAGSAIENIAKRHGIVWGHDYDWRRVEEVRELEKTGGVIAPLHTIQTSLPNVKSCFKQCPCGEVGRAPHALALCVHLCALRLTRLSAALAEVMCVVWESRHLIWNHPQSRLSRRMVGVLLVAHPTSIPPGVATDLSIPSQVLCRAESV